MNINTIQVFMIMMLILRIGILKINFHCVLNDFDIFEY